jgi:hypothetical protein
MDKCGATLSRTAKLLQVFDCLSERDWKAMKEKMHPFPVYQFVACLH